MAVKRFTNKKSKQVRKTKKIMRGGIPPNVLNEFLKIHKNYELQKQSSLPGPGPKPLPGPKPFQHLFPKPSQAKPYEPYKPYKPY